MKIIGGSGVHEAVKRAKSEFWKRADLNELSTEYADVYREMDDGCEKARRALEVIEKCRQLDGDPEERLLYNLDQVSS